MRKVALTISMLLIYCISFAQNTIPSLNKTKIQIGDHFLYSFRLPIENINNANIYIPQEKKDSLEIISSNIDTTVQNGKKYVDFSFKLTSFVVGKHIILNKNGRRFNFEVLQFPIDTTKIEIKDIKANAEEPFTIGEIMPIIIWTLIIVALCVTIYFGYKIWKKYRKVNIKEVFIKPKPKFPAHVNAINSLNELRLKRLFENGRIKEYYSEISDILRIYLDERFSIAAIEMTTDEIFSQIKKEKAVNNDSYYLLEYILKYSDLVKFAKYIPDSFISDKCMKDAFEFVNQTKPIELENQNQGKEDENV